MVACVLAQIHRLPRLLASTAGVHSFALDSACTEAHPTLPHPFRLPFRPAGFPAALTGTWRLVFSSPSPIKAWQYIPVLEDAIIDVDAGAPSRRCPPCGLPDPAAHIARKGIRLMYTPRLAAWQA